MTHSSDPTPHPSLAILGVEDDPAVRALLVRALSQSFEVAAAPDGAAGLVLIERSGPFTVVIADLVLPRMSGSTFLAEVRARAPRSVRILLSGSPRIGGMDHVVQEGLIYRFLAKPFTTSAILQVVEEAVEQYQRSVADENPGMAA